MKIGSKMCPLFGMVAILPCFEDPYPQLTFLMLGVSSGTWIFFSSAPSKSEVPKSSYEQQDIGGGLLLTQEDQWPDSV